MSPHKLEISDVSSTGISGENATTMEGMWAQEP